MDRNMLDTGWENVLVLQGTAIAGRAWDDEEMLEWTRLWLQPHKDAGCKEEDVFLLQHESDMKGVYLNDYCGNWGFPLVAVPMMEQSVDTDLRAMVVRVAEHILTRACRICDDVIAHGGNPYARRSVWVDTLYYTSSVLAEAHLLTGDLRYATEAIRQAQLHTKFLRDAQTGLFFHDVEPETGRGTSWFWARGNGWVILALADTLRRCPASLPGWRELLETYRSIATGLLRLQQACGLWRIVPESPEAHLETSGSAMIAAGLAIGVGEEWLEPTVAAPVLRAVQELVTWIRPGDGALMGAQRPAGNGGWESHKLSVMDECSYATGLFLRLLGESEHYQLL